MPIVFILKKGGSLRFCVDHKKKKPFPFEDAYPIPLMDKCLDKVVGSFIFFTLTGSSRKCQVASDDWDKDKQRLLDIIDLETSTNAVWSDERT